MKKLLLTLVLLIQSFCFASMTMADCHLVNTAATADGYLSFADGFEWSTGSSYSSTGKYKSFSFTPIKEGTTKIHLFAATNNDKTHTGSLTIGGVDLGEYSAPPRKTASAIETDEALMDVTNACFVTTITEFTLNTPIEVVFEKEARWWFAVEYTEAVVDPNVLSLSVYPADGETNVDIDAAVKLNPSKEIENPVVTVKCDAVAVEATYDATTDVVSFTKEYDKTYTITVTADNLDNAVEWSFTVESQYVSLSVYPADGETNVDIDAAVKLNPSKEIENPVVTVKCDAVAVEATYDATTDVVSFTKEYTKTYTITVEADNLENTVEWSFTTEDAPTCPVDFLTEDISWTTPTDKATDVVVDNTMYVSEITGSGSGGFKLNKVENGGYIMFAIPANMSGNLQLSVKSGSSSDERAALCKITNNWQNIPVSDEEGSEYGTATLGEYTQYIINVEATAEAQYLFVFHEGGNAYYKDFAWTVVYDENIVTETSYFLNVNKQWEEPEGCWYAAKFVNKNTDAYAWVKGEKFVSGDKSIILYYLSQYNVPSTRSGEVVYTDVEFIQLPATVSSDADLYSLDLTGVEYKTTGEVFYESGVQPYYTLSSAEAGEWETSVPTAIENIEVADGIRYACGVVEAEGAIEVYSVNGAVVARGNDIVDLRGLAAGIYIVRNGNQVRKVVR